MLSASLAWGQAGAGRQPVAAPDDDTPDTAHAGADSRAVRLSYVEGNVRVTQDTQIIADPAVVNLPLFQGSEVTTGDEGRAEIQMEDGSIARLSPNTSVLLSVLQGKGSATQTEILLSHGLAYFELQPSNADHSLRINFGQSWFSPNTFSVVRLSDDTPPGEVAVLAGTVHLENSSSVQVDIHEGESLAFDAADAGRYNLAESISPNSWDQWNSDRDQLLNSEAAEKTPATSNLPDYPGNELSDLDANGSWYNVPGQGYIWSPYDAQAVGASWDPYGYGRWVFYPRYGYVWVSGYGWGYAPYQCGLWNYYDNFGWGWAPGAGCNPWWGFGGGYGGDGGWIYRLGNRPPGYRPPHRPVPGPTRPLPVPRTGPLPRPGQGRPSEPVITVDHRSGSHPVEGRGSGVVQPGPVVIAGRTVEPMRPVAPRETVNQPRNGFESQNGFVNRSAPIVSGSHPVENRPGDGRTFNPSAPSRPANTDRPMMPNRPSAPAPVYRPAPPPRMESRPAPSGGGSFPHSAPAPAPPASHPSPHK